MQRRGAASIKKLDIPFFDAEKIVSTELIDQR
jgi:hypothetical protein